MKLNKTVLQILMVVGLLLIIKPSLMGMTMFSTVSYTGLTDNTCSSKETTCFDNAGLKGKLVDCHIGSQSKCYCEFQSYSRNQCPNNEQPKDTASPIVTQGNIDTTVQSPTGKPPAKSEINFLEDKIGPFKIWWIAAAVFGLFMLLLLKGGSGYAGLKPTGGTIVLGDGKK